MRDKRLRAVRFALSPSRRNAHGPNHPTATSQLSPSEHQVQLRRAVIASTVGTAIEWYDFFLYGTVTGLVFAKLFFPDSDPWDGDAGRLRHLRRRLRRAARRRGDLRSLRRSHRPQGDADRDPDADGHRDLPDRAACRPTSTIGIWGAVILTVLRFIQGIGVGGEWGGSVLMAMEWARAPGKRGFIASWPQFGVPCGLFLANLAVLAFSQMSGDQFLTWGWRVPFLLSIVPGRGRALDPPRHPRDAGVRQARGPRKIENAPILEVIKRQPKEIVLPRSLRMAEQAPFYIFTAFVFAYGTGTLQISRDFLLTAVLCAACCRSSRSRSSATSPTGSGASDVHDRRGWSPACSASSISACWTPAVGA